MAPHMRPLLLLALLALLALALATPASAQLPGVGQTVGDLVRDPVGQVTDTTEELSRSATRELQNARDVAARQLQRRHRDAIDTDRNGDIVVRNEVLAIAPSEEALTAARGAGFTISETIEDAALSLRIVILRAPRGMSTRRAVETLQRLDPEGAYDFNHLYLGAGPAAPGAKQARDNGGPSHGPRIGLIDSGVDAAHPAFAGVAIVQRGFAGEARAAPHGTAVASLLGDDASLFVADVYGAAPTGGGASAIVAAIGWLAQSRVGVINVSLVGPPNRALEAAIRAAIARGHVIVAAVGNDGPAAAPLYPAAYAGVVGVTGVDARNRVLPEAGRGEHVDFAALGMVDAAAVGGRTARVRGTSYAAPAVARLLAHELAGPDPGVAARAQQQLAASARDLGARGRDAVYGAGLVGGATTRGAALGRDAVACARSDRASSVTLEIQ